MADGGGVGGGAAARGAGGAPPSSSLPGLSAERGATSSAPQPATAPSGGGLGGGPEDPAASPPLTGGEFLLHLLQGRTQSRAEPHHPSSSSSALPGSRDGGTPRDPAVAVFAPGVPFPQPRPPTGGFLDFPAAPANSHPHAPRPWPGHPGLHQAPWAANPSESRPPPPQPPGFHHHERHNSHRHHSSSQGTISGFPQQLGFLGGRPDQRDLYKNPGHVQNPQHHSPHQQYQQQPRRDALPTEGSQLVFGSFGSPGVGDHPGRDPLLPGNSTSSPWGLEAQHRALNTRSTAHALSARSDHEADKVMHSRHSISSSPPGSNLIHPSKAHPYQWRETGGRLVRASQAFAHQNSGNLESGRPLYPHREANDERNRAPLSNGENLSRNLEEQVEIQRAEARGLSYHVEDLLSRHLQHGPMLDHRGPPLDTHTRYIFSSNANQHKEDVPFNVVSTAHRREQQIGDGGAGGLSFSKDSSNERDLTCVELVESLVLSNESSETKLAVHASRVKEHRSDLSRGHHVSSQRMRSRRRELRTRHDITSFAPQFISIYESLTPSEEEKEKQKQLLQSLEKLIIKEWPNAQLHLYGSCANSFGASSCDIDVCLAISDGEIDKSKILLRLAEILQSDNLQDVQALTRARVPIVKLKDPATGISCDICINNILAVVNTKLLRNYSQIDHRLRQLVIIVKHWAKSRGVNDTYQGTLSSYAYVLMCIHFLQLRRPAILPCLQEMQPTYMVTVDGIECAFFDQVQKLEHFGSVNRESIAELLWAFFSYWAYHHDYANNVISVRTGGIISKQSKDWTRRIGNDRHLICIEDPFELSHDLGRVVDKFTIKILREEFERAAEIMQYDPNPSVRLFEPYVRPSPEHS
ncbi:unnamed protein product [Spirodela intermedia]|uniref:RNA uridylyltransferase n=1 Tax=Spirodela intermedia TaxID=51605 RepID=A0A7I8KW09_SPIIN|nr:unnamed protein product [Spirodela intermedia]